MFQFNDGAIIQAGMGIVPNLREQLMEDALMRQRNEAFQWEREDRAAAQAAAIQNQQRMAAFEADLAEAMRSGNTRAITALRLRYPEIAKQMKDGFDALDADQRQATLTQVGSIFANLESGNVPRAIDILRQRIEADRAAGMPDPQDEAILAELESGDPARVTAAKATVGIMLASVNPDKFDAVYGKVNPAEAKTPREREYEFLVRTYGKAYADQVMATQDTKTMPLVPGGRIGEFGPDPSLMGGGQAQGGGDPTSGVGAGSPGAAPERPALTGDQFKANLEVLGPQRSINMLTRSGLRVRVRSPQEARSLPSGTPILLPDGREGVVP
jgi:hypothetical protein